MPRPRHSHEWWAEEARFIDQLTKPDVSYVEMQLRHCTEDLGPHDTWTAVIRARLEMISSND